MNSIAKSLVHTDPYEWVVVEPFFVNRRVAKELSASFPVDGFRLSVKDNTGASGKRYRTYDLDLVKENEVQLEALSGLPSIWEEFVEQILSPVYRATLGKLLRIDLGAAFIETRATRYEPGCWIDPHTDREEKIITQLIYFNENWHSSNGGQLQILRSKNAEDVYMAIDPLLDRSAIIKRSDRSWHSVAEVSASAKTADPRRTVLIHFIQSPNP